MKSSIAVAVLLSLSACVSPVVHATRPEDVTAIRQDLAKLQDSVNHLQYRLGELRSLVDAASADNEFKELVIDSVRWARPGEIGSAEVTDELLCHPRDWRGFGKLNRFTKLADRNFVLEADGHAPIDAYMATGGINSDDGSIRFTLLTVTANLDPGVNYCLRPRNQNEQYRWTIDDGVRVAAR